MPWKETEKMDQRMEFVMKASGGGNFRALCREYGISAKTGYKWRRRFVAGGMGAMKEESRRPRGHAGELKERVVCEIVALKGAHRHWGAKKIRELYRRKHGEPVPSESSFKRVLERAGMTEKRKPRIKLEKGRLTSDRRATKPNEVWSVDFKGWWKDRFGLRVEPLTVRDEYSRLILEIRALENARSETVRRCFERLFEEHGMPEAIRSDNGAPFASVNAILGLSRLSAWWLALGIDLERSRPGCPQDNGGHERMHADIRRELQTGRIGRDQAAFDLWREEFNTERPHEALQMRVPAEVYVPSTRSYRGTPEEIDYGSMDIRRVTLRTGMIRYQNEPLFLSTALGGWTVGLSPTPDSDRILDVWFAHLPIGQIDHKTASFQAARPGGLKARPTHPNV